MITQLGRDTEPICTKKRVGALQERGSPSGTTRCLWIVYFTQDEI